MVKGRARPAMVDARLRSGVNGARIVATLGRSEFSIKLRHVWGMEQQTVARRSYGVVGVKQLNVDDASYAA